MICVRGGCGNIPGNEKTGEKPVNAERPPRSRVILMAVVFEGGLVVLWLLLSHVLEMPPGDQGRVTVRAVVLGFFATTPLLPAMLWLARSQFTPFRRLMGEVEEVLIPFLSRLTVADFFIIALLAGFGEEGLFRGIIQGGLSAVIPPPVALLIAALIFGILHCITLTYAVIAALIGLYLGGLYMLTGNLVVPIIVHVLYDFAALIYLMKVRRRITVEGAGKEDG